MPAFWDSNPIVVVMDWRSNESSLSFFFFGFWPLVECGKWSFTDNTRWWRKGKIQNAYLQTTFREVKIIWMFTWMHYLQNFILLDYLMAITWSILYSNIFFFTGRNIKILIRLWIIFTFNSLLLKKEFYNLGLKKLSWNDKNLISNFLFLVSQILTNIWI